MAAPELTPNLVDEITGDLRTRYGLDDAAIRELGVRLAGAAASRSAENRAWAERFVADHPATFERLAQ